ncbi:MAG: hypothetical protein H6713_08595 [Myxococcales bacterium]|nr:hypothetical protein [Myxococcales bacterium]MCB9750046.1 hypothetical protein [Myxococcales bacterium]
MGGLGTRRALPAAALALLTACGDDASGPTTDGATTGEGIASTALEMSSGATTSADETTGATDEPAPLCDAIDVSLVIDPLVAQDDYYAGAGLVQALYTLVRETGARVRVLPNAGTEGIYQSQSGCFELAGNAPDDPILVFGEDFTIDPAPRDALECLIEELKGYSSPLDYGDGMFAGMMFPILLDDRWPAEDAIGLAMLLASADNNNYGIGGMYNRPGMASEAYLRLVSAGDRRRALAFSYGQAGDRIETFGVSLSPYSRHYEREDIDIASALYDFTASAIAACDAHDEPVDKSPELACERLDILFVIDGSGSMDDEQAALQGEDGQPPVFAEFTDALVEQLVDIEDFHVGVVSTQPDATLLHTHRGSPFIPESPETDCGLPEGQRWIVGPSPTLEQDFACIAATRSETVEVPTRNAAEALANPGNAGFLRDDSLLIIVVVTDEDEQTYKETMWIRETILDAVGGDLERVLMLAIAGDQGIYEMPKTTCAGPYGIAVPGRRIASVTRSLRDRGFTQDICEGDMAKTFEDLLAAVLSVCTPEP